MSLVNEKQAIMMIMIIINVALIIPLLLLLLWLLSVAVAQYLGSGVGSVLKGCLQRSFVHSLSGSLLGRHITKH